jgi:hypothetical protein
MPPSRHGHVPVSRLAGEGAAAVGARAAAEDGPGGDDAAAARLTWDELAECR